MPIANKALAVLAALAFLLPFVSLSCSTPYGGGGNKFSIDITGAKLVQCYVSPCSVKDLMGSKLGPLGKYIPDNAAPDSAKIGGTGGKDVGLNFVLFAAIAVVVAVIPLFFGARGGELLSGLASVGVIVLLFLFRNKFGDAIAPGLNAPEMKAAGSIVQFQVQYAMGFWACAVLSGLSAILAFKGTLGGQSPVSVGAPGATGGYAPPYPPGAPPPSNEQLAVCSACGSVNTAGNKFCLSCGGVMPAPAAVQPAPVAQGPRCPSCGSTNAGTGKFCLACGASMAAAAASALEKKASPVAPAPEVKAAPVVQGPTCPSCGSSNAGTGKFCLACGASMAAAAASALEKKATPVAPAPEVKAAPAVQGPTCPSCGSSNAGTGKFCLACGASMAALAVPEKKAPSAAPVAEEKATLPAEEVKAAAEPQKNVCRSCGASNPATSKFCLSCGGSLMASVQIFERSEDAAKAEAAAPVAAPVAALATPRDQQPGGDTSWMDAPASRAAAASVSAPVGQSLPLNVPRSAPPEPSPVPAPTPVISSAPPDPEPPAPQADTGSPVQPSAQEKQQSCSGCGAALNPEQKFCLACGTPAGQVVEKADAPPPPPPPPQQACTACGAFLLPDQKFCLACGTPVSQAAATPASPEHFQPSVETQILQPAAKGSSKAWIVVVLVVAALGAGGWFGWKYFTRPDVTVSTNVQRIHVAAGGKTTLEASVNGSSDTDVDWSIQEGQKGGQITALGTVMSSGQLRSGATYTAPQTGGTFHVIATSHANASRSAKVEVIVGASLSENPAPATAPETPAAPAATTTPGTTAPSPATPASTFPNAAQIVGTWTSADLKATIGADSTISMITTTNPPKNQSGSYHFTDNTHLDVDLGNGDVRKWEILGLDNNYLRINSQSKDGFSAIIFAKVQ